MAATRILVVDDEEIVLTATSRILQCMGFDVQKANGGVEALAVLKESGEQIDVVLTDVNMPGVSGIDVAHEIASTWTSIAVLLVSGKEPRHEVMTGLPTGFRFLRKPYNMDRLRAALDEVLKT